MSVSLSVFLGPQPTHSTGNCEGRAGLVVPESQLLQLPICFPSCDVVQPIPLGFNAALPDPEAQGIMTLPYSQRRHPRWRGSDGWTDRWTSQVRRALLPRSFLAGPAL